MDWTYLFKMQQKLDDYIASNQDLSAEEDLFSQRYLALLVELGELANETRCFKFWSQQDRSADDVILEEFVDGMHFILSLGLTKGLRFSEDVPATTLSEVDQFNHVFAQSMAFKLNPDQAHYNALFISFLQLGHLLGFNETDIQAAYNKKNEINYERQDEGY